MLIEHKSDCELHNGPALPPGDCSCGAAYSAVIITASHGVEDAISITHGSAYPGDIPDSATIAHAAIEALGIPLHKLAEMMPDKRE